jgi:glutamate dehydrogenase/leucine dehydrogenase
MGKMRPGKRNIGEAANGPLTPEADEILNLKGALVVPDIPECRWCYC